MHVPPTAPPIPTAIPPIAATAPTTAHAHKPPVIQQQPVARPTVSLKSGSGHGPATVERREVVQAPRLGNQVQLEPAKIQGPRVVREEKPDHVPVPGRGGPRSPRPGDAPSFTQARPTTGRGVRVTEEEEEEAKKKAAKAAAGRTNSQRRRGGIDGRRGEATEKLREFSEADLEERKTRLAHAAGHRAGVDRHMIKTQLRGHHAIAKTGLQRGEPSQIEEPITVKSLSAALGVKGSDILTKLLRQGVFANINQTLEHETAEMLALEYGAELVIAREATLEEQLVHEFETRERKAENLVSVSYT